MIYICAACYSHQIGRNDTSLSAYYVVHLSNVEKLSKRLEGSVMYQKPYKHFYSNSYNYNYSQFQFYPKSYVNFQAYYTFTLQKYKKIQKNIQPFKKKQYLCKKKMIIAKSILGRLGNQMFQYAFCRAIKEAVGGSLAFSFDKVYQQKETDNNNDGFEDSLRYFYVDEYEVFKGDAHDIFCNPIQNFLYRTFQYIRRNLFKNTKKSWRSLLVITGLYYYNDKNNNFFKDITYIRKKSLFRKLIICYDFLEVPHIIDCIRPILIKEFTPRFPPLSCNQNLYEIINTTNSVCVSIRRGDYLDSKYSNTFHICDETYIRKAIEKAQQLISDPVFIFFSDDIEWVKQNIKTNSPSFYETGKDPVWEKLRLMYSCKHFIISNSTFSWWAQYLSRNQNKIVISPDHWTNDKNKDKKHLIDDSFITIPC